MIKRLKTIEQLKKEYPDYYIDSDGDLDLKYDHPYIVKSMLPYFGNIVTIEANDACDTYQIEENNYDYDFHKDWFEDVEEFIDKDEIMI